jgi:hypothetical protein
LGERREDIGPLLKPKRQSSGARARAPGTATVTPPAGGSASPPQPASE